MLKTIAKIDWGRVPYGVFVTLTYPDECWERDYYQRTIDRSRWIRDIEKYLDREISILWRIEWQKRKSGARKGQYAPHLHLMLLGVRYVAASAVRQYWRGVLRVVGPLCTDVRAVTGKEGVGRYLAKYISKASSLDNAAYLNRPWMAGRNWGLTRPSLVPWADVTADRELSEEEYRLAMEALIEMRMPPGAASQESFTLLGEQRVGLFIKNLAYDPCGPYLDRL